MPSKVDPGFYHGRRWRRAAAAYLESQNYICERCGAPARICHHKTYISDRNKNDLEILYSWTNLEALCLECHNREHRGNHGRVMFDESGQVTGIRPTVEGETYMGDLAAAGSVAQRAKEFFGVE